MIAEALPAVPGASMAAGGPSGLSRRLAALGLACLVPAAFFLSIWTLNGLRGPFWLGTRSDPEYAYLLNSLNLAHGKGPEHVDHPGTPVQVFGAAVLRVVHAAGGEGTLAEGVFRDPEWYLRRILFATLLLNSLLLFWVGRAAMAAGFGPSSAVLLQLMPFGSWTILAHMARVSAEPFLLTASLAMEILLVRYLADPSAAGRRSWQIGAALVSGFGCAVKITFGPIVLLPVFLLAAWRARFAYVGMALASFALFALPAAGKFGRFRHWVWDLLVHKGRYGRGEEGFWESSQTGNVFGSMLHSDPWMFCALAMALAAILVMAWRRAADRGTTRLAFGVLAAVGASVLALAKHPSTNRYILPALAISGFLFWAAFGRSAVLPIRIAALLLAAGVAIRSTAHGLRQASPPEDAAAVQALIGRDYRGFRVVRHFRCSEPEFAFHFGLSYSGYRFGSEARRALGPCFFYNPWSRRFSDWDESRTFEQILAASGGRIVDRGIPFAAAGRHAITRTTGYVLE
ncbi:MAG: hypothetical protein AAB215_02690, partial [Planctomycetota bacterium]